MTAQITFYKRPLPDSCINFNSPEGKRLFANALRDGLTESYFLLAGQFVTQNEPAYCALGTLCMVLNAYEVDPQRIFRGVWRFYDQDMLSCCRPLEDVAAVGLTLPEFGCLARCNGLNTTIVSPRLEPESRTAGLERFRRDLKESAQGKATLALSYSRKTLGQTGDGHFSCVGAYSESDDKLLILDVARMKYPSYWIDVELAYDSMIPLDKATGQPRGYALLSPLPRFDSAVASLTTLTLHKSSWATLSSDLTKALLSFPKSISAADLLQSLTALISSRPTSPISARPPASPKLHTELYPSLHKTELGQLTTTKSTTSSSSSVSPSSSAAAATPGTNPLLPLFFLAIFSRKSALTQLVPLGARDDLRRILDDASLANENENESESLVQDEVDLLVSQLGALGECCRAEEEAAVCGCSGPGKMELEQARAE